MKNYEHANSTAFDPDATECYIEDIREAVEQGCSFYFQRVGEKLQIIKWTDTEKSAPIEDAILLWDPTLNFKEESYQCFWNPGLPIIPDNKDSFLHYEWDTETPGCPYTLIWWDHDLGDVVLDTFSDYSKTNDAYDKIADDCYFYYIT